MPDVNLDMIISCPADAVLLDIGANHGRYTVEMAKKGKVYAFEPSPENLKILREAVKDKPNVEVHHYALSDQTGIAKLMIVGNPGGHSIHKILDGQRWKHSLENSVDVATITLDEWCEYNNIYRIDGIKIDVEAHEIEVLKGAMATLNKYKPVIALETHQTIDLQELKRVLEECGYAVPDLKHDAGFLLKPV